jgi:hypothetical protein
LKYIQILKMAELYFSVFYTVSDGS